MKFNKDCEYYIVHGWYDKAGGMHNGAFYGAAATPDNYLRPKRVVVSGEDAKLASEAAIKQPAGVYPIELQESLGPDANGLNPREREDTQHLVLDNDKARISEILAHLKAKHILGVELPSDTDGCCTQNGCQEPARFQIQGQLFCVPHATEIATGPVSEMTGAGCIAMGVMNSGMPDRGGHGRVDNLGMKRVEIGRNRIGKKMRKSNKLFMGGFGDKSTMRTINQANGRRGGKN